MRTKVMALLLPLLGLTTTVWADVEINETNFPDNNFRNYLLEQDYGSDGVLTDDEIKNITYIGVHRKGIQSLKGIEFFTSLTYLNCDNDQLTSLDMSKNTALTELSCFSNQLTSLDVSKNTELTLLSCGGNQLTSLDLSKNTMLTYLDCSGNQLTSLDVTQNTALTNLNCEWNQLTSLDLLKNTELVELYCDGNQLTLLDVSGCTALTTLYCCSNQINGTGMDALVESLPSTSNAKMYVVNNYNEQNEMTTMQAKAAKAKGWTPYYRDSKSQWQEYLGSDPANNIAINETNFPDENFRNYLLEQNYGMDGVLTDAEILSINSISVTERNIQSLKGIEYFTALGSLYCSFNQLTLLDLSKNTELIHLICNDNQLTSLDVSNNTALTELHCYRNRLTSLDVSNNTALVSLLCSDNQFSSLDVTKNTKLLLLYCEYNQLTSLNVSENTELEELRCNGNQLTELDLSKNTELTTLYCYSNQLTALILSKNTALTMLECMNNQLTSLDLSKNTALTQLSCYSNQINGTAMDALVESLPSTSDARMYVIYYENEQNVKTTTQLEAAKAKGWTPYYGHGWNWRAYAGSDILYDNVPNDVLALNTGNSTTITLQGRALHKDGNWNTLCLPFSVSESKVANNTNPLYGATIMELDTDGTYDTNKQTGFDATSGTLYLYFKETTGIEAGKPYLVKWNSGADISDPIFRDVIVDSTTPTTIEATNSNLRTVQFIGTYSPTAIAKDDKSSLVLIGGNKLGYPGVDDYSVKACRAYFHVDLGGNEVKAFVLGLDNETTAIQDVQRPQADGQSDRWTDLNGRQMNRKPGMKGIYMNNGKKVVIK